MIDAIQTEDYKNHTINIHLDELPSNPREDDNMGTMICFHKRYNLGDEHDYDSNDYNSWDQVLEAITKDNDVAVILPLYLYDHSGITMNTTGFSCPWDSGQVGFIFVGKDKLRKEYNVKNITNRIKEKAKTILESEVEIYDKYITGDIYGFVINDSDGENIDSCWGFYEKSDAISEAKCLIDHLIENPKTIENPNQLVLNLK